MSGCSHYKRNDIMPPAKRSQRANATYRNIAGRKMLRAFRHRVTLCCGMLGVVGSSLKIVKFEPTTPNTSQHGNRVAKRTQHVAPNNVALAGWDRWSGLNVLLMSLCR